MFSVLSGGSLNPPPCLLVEDKSGGGLGMVSFLVKHVRIAGLNKMKYLAPPLQAGLPLGYTFGEGHHF
jgi:hypothetical protein